jgi:hypothetical protein
MQKAGRTYVGQWAGRSEGEQCLSSRTRLCNAVMPKESGPREFVVSFTLDSDGINVVEFDDVQGRSAAAEKFRSCLFGDAWTARSRMSRSVRAIRQPRTTAPTASTR